MAVRRGELYWADLDPVVGSEQGGVRPVLVCQADPINMYANTSITLAITSQPQRANYPLTIALDQGEGGLPKASWIKVTQMRTLSLKRLRGRLGALTLERLNEVDRAIVEVLDINLEG